MPDLATECFRHYSEILGNAYNRFGQRLKIFSPWINGGNWAIVGWKTEFFWVLPKFFLNVIKKYFTQRLKFFSQPLWRPKTFWLPNSMTKKLDNQKFPMTRTNLTRKFFIMKKQGWHLSGWKKLTCSNECQHNDEH